jgi:hypothetical protein
LEQRELNGAEFKGYVTAKLEDIGHQLVSVDNKLGKLDECVGKMRLKVAAIGGTVSLVVTIVVLLLKDIISK